jgi:hypothetical protein
MNDKNHQVIDDIMACLSGINTESELRLKIREIIEENYGKGNDSISVLQDRIKEWADRVFPERTPWGIACKLVMEEIPELVQNMEEPHEYADCVILLLDMGRILGIDVSRAVMEKIAINDKRMWIVDDTTGLMRHV